MITLPGGVVVEVIEPERIQSFWLKGQYYEQEMLAHIRAMNLRGTFVDGGACVGNHALYFAKFCAQQVIAVEPVKRNISHAQINLDLSGLGSKVIMVEAALDSAAGAGSMLQAGNNHGTYTLVSGNDVRVTTLDDLVELADFPITLVKLDIQGYELRALQGARTLLENHRPVLFVELIHEVELQAVDYFLAGFGYKRTLCFNPSPTYKYVTHEISHS